MPDAMGKSFLLLFFKKEDLFFPTGSGRAFWGDARPGPGNMAT
jgi:hypothetical protein